VGHFRVYELFQFLMFVLKVLNSPLQCHACTSSKEKDGELDH
jgi:hypothetical protein